jgi:hypothetical protein
MCLAAEAAGVSPPTARRYRLDDPERVRELKSARLYFAESMEYELVKQARGESKGSFLATVARLKATRRRMLERYSEKVADTRVLNLTINQQAAPPDLPATVARMLDLSDDERRAMQGLPPLMLPGASPAILDAECQRSPNFPQVRSSKLPHPG